MAEKGSRKRGIKKLIHNAQVTSLQKQNQDNSQEMNVYERYLVRGVGVPAILLLGAGLVLVAVISLPILIGIVTIYHTPQAIFYPPLDSGDTVYSLPSLVGSHRTAPLRRCYQNPLVAEQYYLVRSAEVRMTHLKVYR